MKNGKAEKREEDWFRRAEVKERTEEKEMEPAEGVRDGMVFASLKENALSLGGRKEQSRKRIREKGRESAGEGTARGGTREMENSRKAFGKSCTLLFYSLLCSRFSSFPPSSFLDFSLSTDKYLNGAGETRKQNLARARARIRKMETRRCKIAPLEHVNADGRRESRGVARGRRSRSIERRSIRSACVHAAGGSLF